MREHYFSFVGVGCNKHVVALKCDYFPAVEAKSSTTKVCGRLRKNSIPFDSAALAPEQPSPEDRLRRAGPGTCRVTSGSPNHENEGWKD